MKCCLKFCYVSQLSCDFVLDCLRCHVLLRVKEGGEIANKRLFFLIATVYRATVSLHAWAVTDELIMVMVGRYTNYLRRCRGSFIQCILDEVLFEILLRLPAQLRFRSGLPSVSRTLEAVKEGGEMANKRLFFLIATVYWATVSLHTWAVTDELIVSSSSRVVQVLKQPDAAGTLEIRGCGPLSRNMDRSSVLWIIHNQPRNFIDWGSLEPSFLISFFVSLAGLLVQAIRIEAVFVFASQILQV
ncbi:hypothetical protein OROHE_000338 [Orobanche hederae]